MGKVMYLRTMWAIQCANIGVENINYCNPFSFFILNKCIVKVNII